jgi:hypothetical protein
MSHLSIGDLSGMVFEHFQDSFNLKDSTNGFIKFHQLISHMATKVASHNSWPTFLVPLDF